MGQQPLRWISATYRGLYIHVLAFELLEDEMSRASPGPKWGYLMGVGRSKAPTSDMQSGPDSGDHSDYFTREAAEQAALHHGRSVADVIVECY